MKMAFISLLLFLNITPLQNDFGAIELVISETSSDDGVIQVLIFDQENGWPESLDDAWKMLTLPIVNGIAKKTIANVPTGKYAVTVFHDHNEDGEIRKNKVGYPLDDFGFSNNPRLIFGAPAFGKCSQQVNPGKPTRFEVELR